MKDLFYRLIIFLNTASEKDTNYNIALFMANNFYRISTMRISELADACYVSPATISRFCRALGYENFAHLKQECMSFHADTKKFNNLINIPLKMMKKTPTLATDAYVKQVVKTLLQLPATLDWKVIDQVLRLIHDTKEIALFGTQFSNSAAIHFQTDLLMLEKFSLAYMDGERQLECAKKMSSDGLAIIFSVNGNYAIGNFKTLQYLRRSGCTTVLITCASSDCMHIPIDYTINIGHPEDGKTGKHALLTTVELMSLRYYTMYYPSLDDLQEKLVNRK